MKSDTPGTRRKMRVGNISSSRKVQLCIKTIKGNKAEHRVPLVLIEGDRATLEFLGRFILNHARHPRDCGIQMFPKGPGALGFSPESEMGIYLHRLPCWNEIAKVQLRRKGKVHTSKDSVPTVVES